MKTALQWAFLILFSILVMLASQSAKENHAEGFDGYSFLGQTWRVTDPGFKNHSHEGVRPRGFVAILSGFDAIYRRVSGVPATMTHFHHFTSFIAMGTILVWIWALRGHLPPHILACFGILMSLHYLFFTHATFVLADAFSSFLMGLFFGLFLRYFQSKKHFAWIALGIVAGFIAVTKYGHFLFVPILGLSLMATTFLFERRLTSFPWNKFGVLTFFHFLTIEVLYRALAGLEFGLFFPISLHLKLKSEFLGSSEEAAAISTYLQQRKWLYFEDFYYAYGPILIGLFVFSILVSLLKARAIRKKWMELDPPSRIGSTSIAFACFLLAAMHCFISVKETRYFLPFIPLALVFISTALGITLSSMRREFALVLIVVFAYGMQTPLRNIATAWSENLELNEDPRHREIPHLFAFLKEPLAHKKACDIVYVCDRTVRGLRLDRNVYSVHLPGAQIYRNYCSTSFKNIAEMRESLKGNSPDEFAENMCFVSGVSEGKIQIKPPMEAYRPYALQITEPELQRIKSTIPPNHGKITCEKNANSTYDCYLKRLFFAFG